MGHNQILNTDRLRTLGYRIEHLGEKWPRAHHGEYRWVNDQCGSLQHHDHKTYSEYDAWADAQAHAHASGKLKKAGDSREIA
jgi:hypothetical protein